MHSKTFGTSQLETTLSTEQVVISLYMRVSADASPPPPCPSDNLYPVARSEVIRRAWAWYGAAVFRLGVRPRHENWICCTVGICDTATEFNCRWCV